MFKKNNLNKMIPIHLVCWFCYFILSNCIYYFSNDETVFISSALHQSLVTICIFYVNALVIAPRFIPSKKYFLAILSGAVLVGLFSFLRYILDFKVMPSINVTSAYTIPDKKFILDSVWFGTLYLLISYGYWAALHVIQLEAANRILEEQKRKAVEAQLLAEQENNRLEMVFLKMQIKPHFMHNVLSSVYTRVHKLSPESAFALMSLTDLLRYTTQTERFDEKVFLRDELENIKLYLDLQRFRFGENFYYQLQIEGDPDDLQILPLVLLSFIENAIKYGEFTDPSTPLNIKIDINEMLVRFSCYNVKTYHYKANTFSSGIGLDNIQRRLEKVYGKENYQLLIEEKEKDYLLNLNITL